MSKVNISRSNTSTSSLKIIIQPWVKLTTILVTSLGNTIWIKSIIFVLFISAKVTVYDRTSKKHSIWLVLFSVVTIYDWQSAKVAVTDRTGKRHFGIYHYVFSFQYILRFTITSPCIQVLIYHRVCKVTLLCTTYLVIRIQERRCLTVTWRVLTVVINVCHWEPWCVGHPWEPRA